jgi:hypothetical protein
MQPLMTTTATNDNNATTDDDNVMTDDDNTMTDNDNAMTMRRPTKMMTNHNP